MGNLPSAPHEPLQGRMGPAAFQRGTSLRRSHGRGMDRLRRSFRDSFRRRKGDGGAGGGGGSLGPESARAHQWHDDEVAVRNSTCAFYVKYLGCVEVFESRGMQVCEEALKVLRSSRRRAVRAMLHVSGDGLRVVEEDTKGLIVDQTIEKVSFCAPDRNHERGFSYICRDGTTRRWMCHGFLAVKDPGERLSHAVGCAFSACLERKQRRDKETLVAQELTKSQHHKILSNGVYGGGHSKQLAASPEGERPSSYTAPVGGGNSFSNTTPTPTPTILSQGNRPKPLNNPFAIERPHAAPHMLERQGSFRGFSHLNNNSPFKRQMSLRINELPSNLERLRAAPPTLPPLPQATVTPTIHSVVTTTTTTSSSALHSFSAQDPDLQVAALCQQVSRGLQLLTQGDTPGLPAVSVPVEQVPVESQALPAPDQWLGQLTSPPTMPQAAAVQPVRRPPPLAQRARSLGGDPFDADWVVPSRATNPFLQKAI